MAKEKPIEKFVDKLIEEANISLPEEELSPYKQKLTEQVQRRIGLDSLKELDEKGLEEYRKLAEKNPSSKEIQEFFTSHIDNYEEKMRESLENFSREFFRNFKKS